MTALLRPARADDAGAVAAIYAPIVRDTPISFEIDPPSLEEMRRRIETTSDVHPWLVCAEGEAVLGYAYASRHRERAAYRWSVDVSVYIDAAQRGRGAGAGLYHGLLEILRLQGFHRAYAGITLPNPASVGLHESAGFTQLGVYQSVGFKCGAWHDVGWWERSLAEPAHPSEAPLPFARVAESAEVGAALAAGRAIARGVGVTSRALF